MGNIDGAVFNNYQGSFIKNDNRFFFRNYNQSTSEIYNKGESVSILYDKVHPNVNMIDSFIEKFSSLIGLGICIVSVLVSIYIYFKGEK